MTRSRAEAKAKRASRCFVHRGPFFSSAFAHFAGRVCRGDHLRTRASFTLKPSCMTEGNPSISSFTRPRQRQAAAAVARKPHGAEFAACLDFARDQAMSGHGRAPPWAEGRHGGVKWRSGKLSSCSCSRSRGRRLRAASSTRSPSDRRRWASARRRPRRRRRRSAGHRSHTTGAWPQRRGSPLRSPEGRAPPNWRPSTDSSVGIASFYKYEAKTASGEQFNPRELTAAHRTLPFGTRLRVTNVATGQSVTVRVNDRGPFIPGRVVDVSHSAAEELGMIDRGITKVRLEVEK